MKYKILLLNLGYFSGLNGSLFDYVFKSWRYFFPSKKIVEKASANLQKIIFSENPDIICLVEVRGKHIKHLLGENYKFYDIETKYSQTGWARKLPFLKDQCDCFISKERVEFQKFFRKKGTKKLIYGINIPGGIRLLLSHFALGKKARAAQFDEIIGLMKKDGKTIICGDFNIFGGLPELDNLINKTGLEIVQKAPTFPAYSPKKSLDLFLVPKGLSPKTKVIKADISDHLPVSLEIEL